MDLLPGPAEEAAVARLRTEGDAALASGNDSVTVGAVVAVELGRTLAPLVRLASLVSPPGAVGAFAIRRPDGSATLIGAADADAVVVWDDEGVGLGAVVGGVEVLDGIDVTTPLARVTLGSSRPLGASATERAHVLAAAYLAGLAQGAQEASVEHATTRVQFDRPIGANQALQHRLADCATRTEAAWATVLYAATACAEARPDRSFWVAAAARTAVDAADENGRTAIQVHGGRGYTLDCPAHVYLVRARLVTQLLGGVTRVRRELLASTIM
jgi:alkylation response protein AidB-like acyl-CoA dehydrogenase